MCLVHSIIIAVDAGMETGKWYGNCQYRKITGCLEFRKDIPSQKHFSFPQQQKRDHRKTAFKNSRSFFLVGGNVLGQSRLDGTGANRKGNTEQRVDHIVKSQTFCTYGA